MTYSVGVELEPPEGTPDFDGLQRQGVGALLGQGLVAVVGATGPDGIEVEVEDFHVGVHPNGAMLLVTVYAPALEFAEQATGAMVTEILKNSELLADWRIVKCEVGLVDELAMESLAAADGPNAPPADPAERAAMLVAADDDFEDEDVRAKVLEDAARLRAFDLTVFDPDVERAKVAAGALIYVIEEFIDNLFDDAEALSEEDVSVAESDEIMLALDGLPPQFAHHYTPIFARQFLVASVSVTGRLTEPAWYPPACLAEALALHLLVREADLVLEELLDETGLYDGFAAAAFKDLDPETLYDPALDGAHADVSLWFVPFAERTVHPYAESMPSD